MNLLPVSVNFRVFCSRDRDFWSLVEMASKSGHQKYERLAEMKCI